MSYQVIARKWRPQGFGEVTGQEHVTRTLRNAIEHERLHHAYLFSGARGVGKTTTARLFAKALNCHKTAKPNPVPCKSGDADICPSCLEITESRSIDVLEFDAASNTGVQDIRDIILENINIGAARDRYRVFIIDEVHMLSGSSFNALLKTVEEPPPNVVFVMATTELHKVPDTITSRCQEFVFRTIPQQQIFERLRLIADAEKIDVEDDALRIVARSGEGSMRDAQSNFDQVISFSGGKIAVDDVISALGLAGGEVLAKVIHAIGEGRSKDALDVVATLVDNGLDLRNYCRELLGVIRDLLIYKVSSGDGTLVESSVLDAAELKKYAEYFSEADLVRLFHSLAETETRLKDAVQTRYVLEIGLVKLIEMRRVKPVEEILERLAKLESGAAPLAAAAPEKKTLNPEPETVPISESLDQPSPVRDSSGQENVEGKVHIPDEPDLGIDERAYDDSAAPDLIVTEPEFVERPTPSIDLSFVASLPARLSAISSEDLEHVEDKWLDDAYEAKLERSGDDCMPLANAVRLAAAALGTLGEVQGVSNGSNGSAAAAARQIYAAPAFEADDAVPLPELSENPTENELIAYANAHPDVRRAMRIFRAKVISVTKKV